MVGRQRGQVRGSQPICGQRPLRIAGAAIDIGPGGRVQNDIGRGLMQQTAAGGEVGQVRLKADLTHDVGSDELVSIGQLQS